MAWIDILRHSHIFKYGQLLMHHTDSHFLGSGWRVEPTSGLNDEEADRLMEILERLKAQGMTIIYISHRLKEIMRISDRVTIMRDGLMVKDTSVRAFTTP